MLGQFPEVDGKTLLLKTPYIYVRVHSEMKPILIWEFHLYWLVFMILQVPHTLLEEESISQSHPVVNPENYSND